MKHAYALIAALLVVGATAFPVDFNYDHDELNELDYDLIDFYKLVSPKKFEKVIEKHAKDPELWEAFNYLMSDEFHKLVYAAEDSNEFQKYVLYLQKVGYNAIRELRQTHRSLGMKEYVPPTEGNQFMSNMKKGGGLDGLLDDISAIFPKKEIQELHAKKLKESPAFAKFSAAVKSPEFAEIALNFYEQEAAQNLFQEAKAHGVDLVKIHHVKNQLIGFA